MSKFAVTKYIYTQDPSDERGIAWTKYVLDYVINGEDNNNSGNEQSVRKRLGDVFSRKIPEKEDKQVKELFSSKNDDAYQWFVKDWAWYITIISTGTLDNNKYMRKLYDLLLGPVYNNFDIRIKKILSAIFYISNVASIERNESTPFTQNPLDVDKIFRATNLGKTIHEEDMHSYKVLTNVELIIYNEIFKTEIRDNFGKMEFTMSEDNEYENYLRERMSSPLYNLWPKLTPGNYYSKLFERLNYLDAKSKEYSKYDYNGPDRDYDFIKNNYWKRAVDKNGKNIYIKRDGGKYVPMSIDQATNNKESTCYDLGIKSPVCGGYINAILHPDPDVSAELLSTFIKNNPDAFTSMKQNINEIHPGFAIVILKRFGFTINKKNEIISVGEWLKHYMKKYFKDEQLDELIKKNKKLLDFLDYLVRFINYNPTILDPNAEKAITGKDMEDYYYIYTTKQDLEQSLKYLKTNRILNINTNIKFDPFIFNNLFGANFGPMNVLTGGGNDSLDAVEQYDQGYKLMNIYFKHVKDELAKYGKQLDEADEQHIMRLIDNLKYYEDLVYDKLKLIASYVDSKDNDKHEELGEKEINKLANLNKFKLARENYNLQGDQVINALLLALDKLDTNTKEKINEIPIPLN